MQDASPTPNRFVARAPGLSASALASRLRGVGPVETFEEGDAVIVDLPDAPGGARAGWERLRATFGDAVEFLPILRGASDGESTVPTGQVTVRFRSVPTAEAVRALLHESPGETTGYREVTILVRGTDAAEWLAAETGVHRLS
ncbi:MAG: hypothetical protein U0324_24185 [Polyangiales bacterium]